MGGNDGRIKDKIETGFFSTETEVYIFQIHKVALVEEAYFFEDFGTDKNTGKGDNGGFARSLVPDCFSIMMFWFDIFPVHVNIKTMNRFVFDFVAKSGCDQTDFFVIKVFDKWSEEDFREGNVGVANKNVGVSLLNGSSNGWIVATGKT